MAARFSDRADTDPADVLELRETAPVDVPNVLISLNRMTRAAGVPLPQIDTTNHISGPEKIFIS